MFTTEEKNMMHATIKDTLERFRSDTNLSRRQRVIAAKLLATMLREIAWTLTYGQASQRIDVAAFDETTSMEARELRGEWGI